MDDPPPDAGTPGKVAVIGTGLMARGLAAAFAAVGLDVVLAGRDGERTRAAMADAAGSIPEAASRAAEPGRLSAVVLGAEPLTGVEVAVETVIEDLDVKRAVLAQLESVLPDEAVIGSNTASLSINDLAAGLRDPGRLAGWHFMNPAHLTALAEVISGSATRPETVDTLTTMTRDIGKTPIAMKFALPGFVWNRLIFAMWRECDHIVRSGAADRASVDAAVSDGLAPRWVAGGPFVTMDLGGLDDFARAAVHVLPTLSNATEVPQDLAEGAAGDATLYAWTPEQREATQQLRREALARGAELATIRRGIGLNEPTR